MMFNVCLEVTDPVWVSLLGFRGALDALRTGYIALRTCCDALRSCRDALRSAPWFLRGVRGAKMTFSVCLEVIDGVQVGLVGFGGVLVAL